MKIDNEYDIKQKVYLITDVEQLERIVTGINIRETSMTYELSCGTQTTFHIGFEISEQKTYY
tara:strand:+ start:2437 stop:2622 length:186 start_codon:yes stop_codon:yes gene_type:complete